MGKLVFWNFPSCTCPQILAGFGEQLNLVGARILPPPPPRLPSVSYRDYFLYYTILSWEIAWDIYTVNTQ